MIALLTVVGSGIVAFVLSRPKEVTVAVKPPDTSRLEKPPVTATPSPTTPPTPTVPTATEPAPEAPAESALVNVNTADAAALESVPGIGPALAQRIIADRTANGAYDSIDTLTRVSGIGPKLLESLRPHLTVK